jgi:hypothetical protein
VVGRGGPGVPVAVPGIAVARVPVGKDVAVAVAVAVRVAPAVREVSAVGAA